MPSLVEICLVVLDVESLQADVRTDGGTDRRTDERLSEKLTGAFSSRELKCIIPWSYKLFYPYHSQNSNLWRSGNLGNDNFSFSDSDLKHPFWPLIQFSAFLFFIFRKFSYANHKRICRRSCREIESLFTLFFFFCILYLHVFAAWTEKWKI